jgi:hypothetical protein
MKKILSLFLLTFLYLSATKIQAAELRYSNYDWKKDPKVYPLTKEEKEIPELVLKDKLAIEYAYNAEGNLEEYKLIHKITRVNSDEAIEKNNRIYIPSGFEMSFLKRKARVISPSGKVKELSESDIKEAIDEDSKNKYIYFALEGIVKGSEIEYFYFIKLPPYYSGSREIIQTKIPQKNVEFEIASPINLIFKVKSYNGLPELQPDTTDKTKNILFLKLDNVPALKVESQAAYTANLTQLVYKLNSNTASGKKDITSYGSVSENLFKSVCTTEKGQLKKVKKLLESINVKFARDEEDKIRIIEQYLKNNFVIVENNNPELSNLEYIIKNKVADKQGMVRLFAATLNALEIEYQLVLTCDRDNMKFDPVFEAYNFLNEYLIYIPSLKMYLAPTHPFHCLGFVPHNLTNTYGLFIKKLTLDKFETGVGKIKFIEPVSYEKTFDNIDVNVDFGDDIYKPNMKMELSMGGYYAQYYQPFYTYYTAEDKKKTNEGLFKNLIPKAEIKDIKVENEGRDYFGIRPFILKASFTCESLVEKAGDKILFKVGELIGPQVEMYQKEERKQDMESDFSRDYHRVLTLKIPAGFKITNLNVLNMDIFMLENGSRTTAFTSKYTLEGNILKINVDEYYKKITFPVAQFESYRKVVNAAADFNKITLYLEKIK